MSADALVQCQKFLGTIFEPDDVIEFRCLSPGEQKWGTLADLPKIVPWLQQRNVRKSCYIGGNPRREHGGGEAKDVLLARCHYADFDGGETIEGAWAKIEAAGLPRPTVTLSTGGGVHVWWRLASPLLDLNEWQVRQRKLNAKIGSDPTIKDAPRIMRLPGFANVKKKYPDPKPICAIEDIDPSRVYPVDDITPPAMSKMTRAFIDRGECHKNDGRRDTCFLAAADLRDYGWAVEEAIATLMRRMETFGDIPQDEIEDCRRQIPNAWKREPRAVPFGAGGKPGDPSLPRVEDVDAIPLETRPWPARPSVMLSHGVVGDLLSRVEMETEADPVAIATTFLVCLGSVVGRGPHAVVDGNRHGVNLFATIIGGTSEGRKGTSLSIVRAVLRDIDEEWVRNCKTSNLTSGEGLIDLVRDDVIATRESKKTGETETYVAVPGVEDKRLLFECQELAAAMRAGKSDRSTLFPTLREAWDGQDLRTATKNNPRRATEPHIAGVAHITPEELFKLQSDADIFGGTWNRFLWIAARRSRLCPHGGDFEDMRDLQDQVRSVVNHAQNVGRMRRTAAADRLWEQEYFRRADNLAGGTVGAILGRAEAQILRLSMLAALCRREAVVDECDLAAALDLWRYVDETVRMLFAHGEDPAVLKIVQAVKASPGISRADLHRSVAKTMPASQFMAALSRAATAGAIVPEVVETAGRPRETWHPRGLEKVNKPARGAAMAAGGSKFGRTL
jgi:hypothetical protein